MRKLDKERDNGIVRDYLDGHSLRALKTKYGCSDKLIQNALKRANVPRHRGYRRENWLNHFTDDEAKVAAEKYKNGSSSIEIAKLLNRSKFAVLKWLKKSGIKRRTTSEAGRTLPLDETVFDTINEESAYWAGFIMADGCLMQMGEDSFVVQIALAKKDAGHIEKLKLFLKAGHKIITYKGNHQFSIHSKRIFMRLGDFGLKPRKSFTAKATDLIKDNRHFWRGVVDGDGSLFITKRKVSGISLVGSFDVVNQFSNFLKNELGSFIPVYKHKMIFSVQSTGKKALQIMKLLYNESNVYLDRKKEKCNMCIGG